MGELLGKDEQLAMWNFQALRRWRDSKRLRKPRSFRGCRSLRRRRFRCSLDQFDSDGDAALFLDLTNGDRAVQAIQHAFNQAALRVSCSVGELWHGAGS